MSGLLQDLRYALRQLRTSPGFSLAVLGTLALALGVNAAVFTLLDGGGLVRPLPYPQADRPGVLLLTREGTVPGTGQRLNQEEDSHGGDTWNWLHATFAGHGWPRSDVSSAELTSRSVRRRAPLHGMSRTCASAHTTSTSWESDWAGPRSAGEASHGRNQQVAAFAPTLRITTIDPAKTLRVE